jgi:hypothetical protein
MESKLVIGEGFTMTEAIVRSIEYDCNDQEILNAVQIYGPDDFEGLAEWYRDRGIYISDPFFINDEYAN